MNLDVTCIVLLLNILNKKVYVSQIYFFKLFIHSLLKYWGNLMRRRGYRLSYYWYNRNGWQGRVKHQVTYCFFFFLGTAGKADFHWPTGHETSRYVLTASFSNTIDQSLSSARVSILSRLYLLICSLVFNLGLSRKFYRTGVCRCKSVQSAKSVAIQCWLND